MWFNTNRKFGTSIDRGKSSAKSDAISASKLALQRAESEIIRARRFNRPLTVVTLMLDASVHEFNDAIQSIKQTQRLWDVICMVDPDSRQLTMLWPETKEAKARDGVHRLIRDVSIVVVKAGYAEYPIHGECYSALTEYADRAMNSQHEVSTNMAAGIF